MIKLNNINSLMAYYKAGNYKDAINLSLSLLSDGENHWKIYNYLGASLFAQNRQKEAINYYLKGISIYNDKFELYNNLGAIYKSINDYENALIFLKKSLSIKDNIDAKINLAGILLNLNKIEETIILNKEILEEDENNFVAIQNLGEAYRIKRSYDLAIEFFNRSIKIKPLPSSYNGLGVTYFEKNQPQKALESFNSAIKIEENFIEAYINKIELFHKQNNLKEAFKVSNFLLKKFPDNNLSYFNHAFNLNKINDFENAISFYKKSININELHTQSYNNLAVIYTKLYRVEEAENLYNLAEELNISSIDMKYNHASLLSKMGKAKESIAISKQSLLDNPNYLLFYDILSATNHFKKKDDDYLNMVKIYDNLSDDNPQKGNLAINIGKALEKMKLYEEASTFYKSGNAYKDKIINYQPKKHLKQFNDIKTLFNNDFIKLNKNKGFKSNKNIFIIGMPRSGSTLVEQILSSHSEVDGLGELSTMTDIVNEKNLDLRKKNKFLDLKSISDVSSEYFYEIGEKYNAIISKNFKPKNIFVDKALQFDRIGWIKLALPDSKIIHCQRNANDQLLSIYKNYFLGSAHGYSYNIKMLRNYYACYSDMMSHWQEVFRDQLFLISYEDLIYEPEKQIRELLKYCKLEWQDGCLDFSSKNKRFVNTISASDVRRPLYNSSIGIWKNYEKSLKSLFEDN